MYQTPTTPSVQSTPHQHQLTPAVSPTLHRSLSTNQSAMEKIFTIHFPISLQTQRIRSVFTSMNCIGGRMGVMQQGNESLPTKSTRHLFLPTLISSRQQTEQIKQSLNKYRQQQT